MCFARWPAGAVGLSAFPFHVGLSPDEQRCARIVRGAQSVPSLEGSCNDRGEEDHAGRNQILENTYASGSLCDRRISLLLLVGVHWFSVPVQTFISVALRSWTTDVHFDAEANKYSIGAEYPASANASQLRESGGRWSGTLHTKLEPTVLACSCVRRCIVLDITSTLRRILVLAHAQIDSGNVERRDPVHYAEERCSVGDLALTGTASSIAHGDVITSTKYIDEAVYPDSGSSVSLTTLIRSQLFAGKVAAQFILRAFHIGEFHLVEMLEIRVSFQGTKVEYVKPALRTNWQNLCNVVGGNLGRLWLLSFLL
ncbi:hypothetical protein CONPUDRAFT_76058 [Coniophora puteana RWD-64-598 SS2]|uniref:Uncharacterized protein n=1 Tax=Coniophora puteana (strain RWD-64-598) TaxID=741705 RepID=A0A5M3ME19_CONPW|nr:uncharacterized protein CONPUDRAFT_76058 [Coniophora puteana RWD-64-598 SS2]EIW77297.1 hypothetical protein CONPUDRAFT_76058 [Coniophora puteana RWD-64-598 SS2]